MSDPPAAGFSACALAGVPCVGCGPYGCATCAEADGKGGTVRGVKDRHCPPSRRQMEGREAQQLLAHAKISSNHVSPSTSAAGGGRSCVSGRRPSPEMRPATAARHIHMTSQYPQGPRGPARGYTPASTHAAAPVSNTTTARSASIVQILNQQATGHSARARKRCRWLPIATSASRRPTALQS